MAGRVAAAPARFKQVPAAAARIASFAGLAAGVALINPSDMRILITGGAGFLGSHLCDKLMAQGHEIVCLDNLFTGSKANIAHLLAHPNFEFVRHDVIDPFKYEVDQIYNLACPASPPITNTTPSRPRRRR